MTRGNGAIGSGVVGGGGVDTRGLRRVMKTLVVGTCLRRIIFFVSFKEFG